MSIFDSTVNQIYSCTTQDCKCKIAVTQKVSDDWLKVCPFCEEESLILDSASTNITTFMDLNKPKTIGSLGEKNYELAEKRGTDTGLPKPQAPFWRKNKKKIDFKVLQNPAKYVETGYT